MAAVAMLLGAGPASAQEEPDEPYLESQLKPRSAAEQGDQRPRSTPEAEEDEQGSAAEEHSGTLPFTAGPAPNTPRAGESVMSWSEGISYEGAGYEGLRKGMQSNNVDRRQWTANQLGRLGDRQAVGLLLRVLQQDASPAVRVAAARSLGLLGDDRALSALQRAARYDPVPAVRNAAGTAAASLGGAPMRGAAFSSRLNQGEGLSQPDSLPRYIQDPQYRAGKRLRLAGALVTAIPGGLGLLLGIFGSIAMNDCDNDTISSEISGGCQSEQAAAVSGFVLLGASMAVGVPLLVMGQGRMNKAQEKVLSGWRPEVDLALGTRRAVVGARWRF